MKFLLHEIGRKVRKVVGIKKYIFIKGLKTVSAVLIDHVFRKRRM